MKKLYTKKIFEHLPKEAYKFANGSSPPVIKDFFLLSVTPYNLQSLYSDNNKTVKFGMEMITCREPQIWNLILDVILMLTCVSQSPIPNTLKCQ